jgi:hypothetical protein
MQTYGDFFTWCASRGLVSNRAISQALFRTPQTIQNWRVKMEQGEAPPKHLSLECAGFDAVKAGCAMPSPGIASFKTWQNAHGLKTLETVGSVFGHTRQAVHNWFAREKLPRWLQLACVGYELSLKDKGPKK